MANNNSALDLELFDITKNGYTPEAPKKRKLQRPQILPDKPVSRATYAEEERFANRAAGKALGFVLVALLLLGSLIYSSVRLTEAQSRLDAVNDELKLAKSENIVLMMKFNSVMSLDKVEEYAQSQLGMVKRENYQVRYFDISNDGGVRSAD